MKTVEIIPTASRVYRCKRCGHQSTQKTNHRGETYSLGHFNTCAACPPWAKYPEFGGSTAWEFVIDEATQKSALLQDRLHNQEFKIASSETNLRYLTGEADTEENRRAKETNLAGIRDARAEIERLNTEASA